jgi:hypothetical protein
VDNQFLTLGIFMANQASGYLPTVVPVGAKERRSPEHRGKVHLSP